VHEGRYHDRVADTFPRVLDGAKRYHAKGSNLVSRQIPVFLRSVMS
jgi:hypothetical protein